MKTLNTEIVIHASPEKIWNILTDFRQYPQWNPFIRSIKGTPVIGHQLAVRFEPPGASGMTLKPRVLKFDQYKEFRWLGHLLFPGLFDGEHSFELTNNGDGSTTFRQKEIFKGIFVPLFKKMLDNNIHHGFQLMNEKLKEMAEK